MVVDILLLPDRQVSREVYIYLALSLGILCSDNDNTVGGTRTIDSRCGCILQHVDAFDIIRVDVRDLGLHRNTVDNYQWRGLCIERTGTTDLHLTAVGRKSCHTSFQVADNIGCVSIV